MRGVIPNSFDHIFTHIARTQNQQYLVRASYLEIYQVRMKYNITKQGGIHVPVHVIIIWQECISIFRQFVWLIFCVLLPMTRKLDIWQEGSPYITLLSTPLTLSQPQVDNPHTIPSLFVICLNHGSIICQQDLKNGKRVVLILWILMVYAVFNRRISEIYCQKIKAGD